MLPTAGLLSVFPAPDSPLRMSAIAPCRNMCHIRHKDALVGAFVYKIPEGLVGHGEDVGLGLLSTSASVHVDVVSRVYRQRAVRIYGDQEQAGVCLGRLASYRMLRIAGRT
jgi:hypothetical protein